MVGEGVCQGLLLETIQITTPHNSDERVTQSTAHGGEEGGWEEENVGEDVEDGGDDEAEEDQ